jgi:hypothetical protein
MIKQFNLNLSDQMREEVKSKIRSDVSNFTRVSDVDFKVTTSEIYEPSIAKNNYYDFLFDKINDLVNVGNHYEKGDLWVMRYTNGQKTEVHRHEKWALIVIYYVDAPEGSGILYFPESGLEIKPYTGLLVVHDGKIQHGVKPNSKIDVERFCVVLNYRKRDEPI